MTSAPRPLEVASWLIRVAVALHALGIAATVFARRGTGIGSVALMEWGADAGAIFVAERVGALALLALALWLLVRPTVAAAVAVSAIIMAECLAIRRFGGHFFVEWTLATQSLRYLAPLALVPLLAMRHHPADAPWRATASAWILRVGVAIVFVSHGAQALVRDPHFIDLIIGSTRRLTGFRPSEAQAVAILLPIGIVDLVVAALLLVGRWRPLLAWMAFWGLLTACSRVTANGWMSYPEVLLRASHYLAPAAVWAMREAAGRATSSAAADGSESGTGARRLESMEA